MPEILTVKVPNQILQRKRKAPYLHTWIGISSVIALFSLATILLVTTPGFSDMGRGKLVIAAAYFGAAGTVGWFSSKAVIKMIKNEASCISSMPEVLAVDSGELSWKLQDRLVKSAYFYLTSKVPQHMQEVRVSPVPNLDGTFWMMATDSNFSTITLRKYRQGDIPEPYDPDAPE